MKAVTTSDRLASQFKSQPFIVELMNSGQSFHLHQDVLSASSLYFRRLFSSSLPTKEQVERHVRFNFVHLLDQSFPLIVEYLYTASYDPDVAHTKIHKCLTHVGVYLLADRLMMMPLKAIALANLRSGLEHHGLFSSPITPSDTLEIVQLLYGDGVTDASGIEDELPSSEISQEVDQPEDDLLGSIQRVDMKDKDDERTDCKTEDPRREMQLVIAHYAAKNLSKLREDGCFRDMFHMGGSFTLDVMMRAGNGYGSL